MTINANLQGTSPAVNSMPNIGAAFTYFSQWDYIQSSTISNWTYGTCYKLSYLYYITNYAAFLTGTSFSSKYQRMNGIVCPLDSTIASLTTASLIVSSGYLPSKWGATIPGYGAYSQNLGQLLGMKTNSMNIGQILSISGTITLPPAGPLLNNIVGQFVIPLPASLDGNTMITIAGNGGTTNIPYVYTTTGTCGIFYLSQRTPIGCIFTSSPTQLQYTLTINEQGLLPSGGSMTLVHYGLQTNGSYSTVTVSITVSSLLNNPTPGPADLIFQKTGLSFPWSGSNYIGISSLQVSSFYQWTTNKDTAESFSFIFTLISKGLYDTNRVRFDLGQFAVDNGGSTLNPTCQVYNYNANGSYSYSHDWAAVDSSQGLAKL
jgi:hypothetical protein